LFDLTAASERMWPVTRRHLLVEGGAIVFLLALGLIVLTTSWNRLAGGQLSSYQIVDLSVVAGMVAAAVVLLLLAVPRRVRGAVSLRLDEVGFELTYPSGKRMNKRWLDPDLEFELVDLSRANSRLLAVPEFPFSIKIRRLESTLTPEAFDAMETAIQRHQLVEETRRGGGWLYPSEAIPVIHRVHAPAERA
jgi:hypothetical protein